MTHTTHTRWPVLFASIIAIATGLFFVLRPSVQADSAAQTLPFNQTWSDTALITTDDDWSAVPGVQAFTGAGLTSEAGIDPQTITAAGTSLPQVFADRSEPDSLTSGGAAEFKLPNPVVALQGSAAADAPNLLLSLDTSGRTTISVSYILRDLDGSADNAVQPVALQYRVGNSGDFTNIPAAFVADATSGPYLVEKTTLVWVNLPVPAENQSLVQLRIITANASGSDEWVGIDDIQIIDNTNAWPFVYAVDPPNNTFPVPVDSNFTLYFNEPVILNFTEASIHFDCLSDTDIPVDIFPDPSDFSTEHIISPSWPLPPGELCILEVPLLAIRDELGDMPFEDFSSQVFTEGCGDYSEPIYTLRDTQVVFGESFIVEGVVTAYTPQMGGYFLQSAVPDSDPATSEGIYVYDPEHIVAPGDVIRLYGKLQQYYSPPASFGQQYHQRELVLEAGIEQCGSDYSIEPTVLDLPLSSGTLADYEGMLVTIPEPLTVQQNYFQGRFGQLTLAADGRVYHPNNGQGGTLEDAVARMIVLDDASHAQNLVPVPYYTADGALRAGDTVSGLTGVLDHGRINASRSDAPDFTPDFPNVYYRLHPTLDPLFTQVNPRPSADQPPAVGGELKVASLNVHNFFATLDDTPYPAGSPYDSTNTPRGADSAAELQRQTDKLAATLAALDADVIGLVEIESWQGAAAVDALVTALNNQIAAGTYAAVPDPAGFPYPLQLPEVGGDFIKVAIIYKPSSVTPLGPPLMDNDPVYSRVPLAQTFQANADGEVFSLVVNHFKSRGSCPTEAFDPNLDSGQGCWNLLRSQQAARLLDFVETVQIQSGDPDVLVMGDLNAYRAEDPLTALTAGGLTDLIAGFVPPSDQYSYIFDGQSGYLDHALANPALAAQTTGAAFWHLNADEPAVIDYNTEYNPLGLYASHPYRSSDHDPLLLGLDLYTPAPSITSDDLPSSLPVDRLTGFHLRVQNPIGSAPLAQAIFHFRISDAALADIAQFEYSPDGVIWLPMSLTQDGADLTGDFGPAEGFPMPAGYDVTTAFRVLFTQPGAHTVNITLEDLAVLPPEARASYTRDINVLTQLYLPLIQR